MLPPYATVGPAKSLHAYLTEGPAGKDLAVLVRLLQQGRLRVGIGWRGPWDDILRAVDALPSQRMTGNAVLDVT